MKYVIRRVPSGKAVVRPSGQRRWDKPPPQFNPARVPDSISRKKMDTRGVRIKTRRNPYQFHYFDTFPQTNCQNNVLVDQPIGYWPLAFNGVSAITETDYSGTHSDLTWTIAPVAFALEDNSGVNLAGDRETSAAAATWQGPLSWTVEWWMQSTGTGAGFMAVISRRAGNDDWAVYIDRTNGRIQINWTNQGGVVSQTAVTSGVNVLDGSMHHCVAETIYNPLTNNTTYQFYVDTIDRGSGTIFSGGSAKTTLEPFRPMGENGSRQFIGKIAGLAFYNYGLTQARVISHFQCIQGTWNPTTIIVRYPRRYPAWRRSKRNEPPWPQAAAPTPPAYPFEILKAERRHTRRVRRSTTWVPIAPQQAAPPPVFPPPFTRARINRNFRTARRAIFFYPLVSVIPPGSGGVIEPISGFLVSDGRTTGLLVTDGQTVGILFTDGKTRTVLIT